MFFRIQTDEANKKLLDRIVHTFGASLADRGRALPIAVALAVVAFIEAAAAAEALNA
jgi:hypothetical protein